MRMALTEAGWAVDFCDFKKRGLPQDRWHAWVQAVGWERLINRQGSTWKKIDPAAQAAVVDAATALDLATLHTSVIKRPIVEWPQGRITVGKVAVQAGGPG
jgi:arsenate reductase-like glutaredoxin family protein